MRLCKDCKFYVLPEPSAGGGQTPTQCSNYLNINLETGELRYLPPKTLRVYSELCGSIGKWWEDRTPPPPPPVKEEPQAVSLVPKKTWSRRKKVAP
jgi:hypothetical protein